MRKRTLYLALLTGSVALVTALVWYLSAPRRPYGEKLFQIADTSQVYEIILADKQGRWVHLKRSDHGWIVNDSYPAEPSALAMLLEALLYQRVVQPVPSTARKNVLRELSVSSFKVVVKDQKGKTLQAFYVGGGTPDNLASYFLKEGDTLPYIVELPGHIGVLAPRYQPDVQSWRRRTILRLHPEQIQQVRVEYLLTREPGFLLERKAGTFSLTPIPDTLPRLDSPALPALHRYLNAFRRIGILAYLPERLREKLASQPPYARLHIQTTDQTYRFTIWLHPVDERTKTPVDPHTGKPFLYDRDRLFVQDERTGEIYLAHWTVWGRLLRHYPEFFAPLFPPSREAPRIYVDTFQWEPTPSLQNASPQQSS